MSKRSQAAPKSPERSGRQVAKPKSSGLRLPAYERNAFILDGEQGTTSPLQELAGPLGSRGEQFNHVSFLIGILANSLVNAGSSLYRSELKLGFTEMRTLVVVGLNLGVSITEISKAAGIDKAAISRSVTLLHGRGLIEARDHISSRRSQRYVLTGAGKVTYLRMKTISDEHERRLLSGLSKQELPKLFELLRKMVAKLPLVEEYRPD